MPTNNSCNYSPTQHNVLVGGASGTITSVVPSTSGFVLTSNGASSDPSFQAAGAASIAYVFQFAVASSTPVKNTTYFLEPSTAITNSTASGQAESRFYMPASGTISAVYGTFTVGGTLSSATNSTLAIRVNNTTDTTVSSSIATTSADNPFNNASLSISMSAGDYFEVKLETGNWVTAPTVVRGTFTVYIT